MSSVTADAPDSGPASESVRVDHGGEDWSPSRAVVEAIAALAGVEPSALADETGLVLYDHVEPDALDALVERRPDRDLAVSFSVGEYRVCVDRDGAVAEPAR
ncbi:HalOD1 output domain-containing protein [Halorubrum sp. AD140]|uniref:HalOD1 output domain-containing protein n=1 Tax=Halorubrum sp. AD140 TaxID=3050073 RepID=UPI002ACC5607|nr:HalOD1 output domain-containing protein [Halorubrum sp. AD140]MDZ5811377.1 HalOD1 output domain-containing protein [Halorubrum sp. AD140]